MADAGGALSKAERKAQFEAQRAAQLAAGGGDDGNKKQMTKAEKRALQEAQRAAKLEKAQGGGGGGGGGGGDGAKGGDGGAKGAKGGDGGGGKSSGGGGGGKPSAGGAGSVVGGSKGPTPAPMQHDDKQAVKKLEKQQITPRTPANKQVPLFQHLPQYEREASLSAAAVAKGNIHPAVLRLGLQMAEGLIRGSNARVVAMLRAFQRVIADFECPPSKVWPPWGVEERAAAPVGPWEPEQNA